MRMKVMHNRVLERKDVLEENATILLQLRAVMTSIQKKWSRLVTISPQHKVTAYELTNN